MIARRLPILTSDRRERYFNGVRTAACARGSLRTQANQLIEEAGLTL
jgi:hypothetical protein